MKRESNTEREVQAVWGKRILQLAGLSNLILGLTVLWATEGWFRLVHASDPFPAPAGVRSYVSGWFLFVILFGLMFLLISRQPEQYAGIVGLGVLGKLSVFGLALSGYVSGEVTALGITIASLNDLVLGLAMTLVLLSPSSTHRSARRIPETGEEPRNRIPPATGWAPGILGWMTEQRFGQPLAPLRIVGHHGWLLFGTSMMETAVDRFDALGERLHSLIALRVAQIVGCPW